MTDTHPTHEWQPTNNGYECTGCDETRPACNTCTRVLHSANKACEACLDNARTVLEQTANALGHWQYARRSLIPAIRYDRDRSDTGTNPEDQPPSIQHPRDVVDCLWSWADNWAEKLTETTNTTTEVAGPVTEWLAAHLTWAANNPEQSGWDDYHGEARSMRHHARRLAGLLPKRHYGPCVHCGGRIVQDWADERWQPNTDGLSDTVRCTGCGLTWKNHKAWMFTNRHTLRFLPEAFPDQLVTIEDAWMIYPEVPKGTWRRWVSEGDLPRKGQDERGRALYRVGDMGALTERRRDDTRRGAKATHNVA